jgi:hypothetical protein
MGYVLLLIHRQLQLFGTVPNFVPTREPGHRIQHSISTRMDVPGAHPN